MTLTVNGTKRETTATTLAGLVAEYGADPRRVAAMVNGVVVRRDEFGSRLLREGDVVEILAFAGGG